MQDSFETMDDVPKQAYTMGIKNIMTAKENPSGRYRRGKGRCSLQISLRTDHAQRAGIYPAASPGCDGSGR